eukprot:TRINITY_DN141924_c0_g1_i1.p1 TRINITY_DN141924_c0_g1~~TRINITY_DN141924_c0_g1_i1.p1  ORF type:complete len:106 (-),score=7.58 TRINITY_DN141924_c0_g1_i1:132-449(-)
MWNLLQRFVWRNQGFQFKALPLGLSLAPSISTKVGRKMVSLARWDPIRPCIYLDDWLIARSKSRGALDTSRILELCMQLDFIPCLGQCKISQNLFGYRCMACSRI